MPVPSANVIQNLPLLKWRGLTAHCESAPFSGSHDQAERRVPYRDAAGHDHTGRAPYKFTVKLWFVETIEPGSFPENFQNWLAALEDGTSGDLVHPIRGKLRARVLTWDVDLSNRNYGGVTIDVTFTETVDNLDDQKALGTPDIDPSAVAAAADAACASFGIDYPDGQAETSLTEAVGAIEGTLLSAGMAIGGKVNQVVGNVASMIETVDSLDDPLAWPGMDTLMLAYASLKDIGKKIEKTSARSTAKIVTQNETTITALASELGADVNDLMGLNLSLLRSPKVPKGATVTYYSD